ncbi:MAG: hypothetical protein V3R41_06545 [Gammaproteobacteria bacterium]
MPVRAVRTLSVVSASEWVPYNQFQTPFNVGFGVVVASAVEASATTYRIEHTFINVIAGDVPTSADIFTHEDVSANNANADGNYAFPVAATRLRVVAISANSAANNDITATFLQTGL